MAHAHPADIEATGPGAGQGLAHSARYLALWGPVWCSLNVQ
jgi:hypothetical protein